MFKPEVTTFHDGNALNIIIQKGSEYTTHMAGFLGNLFWEYMKEKDEETLNVVAYKKGDDFVITVRNSNEKFEEFVKKITESVEFQDVQEVTPLQKEEPEEIYDYRFPSGKYKNKTPKEAVAADKYKALQYMQRCYILATTMPEYMKKEIRKQTRAMAHRQFSKIRDVKDYLTKNNAKYYDYILDEYMLIIPSEKITEYLDMPENTSLKEIYAVIKNMGDEERCNIAKFIIEEFKKK